MAAVALIRRIPVVELSTPLRQATLFALCRLAVLLALILAAVPGVIQNEIYNYVYIKDRYLSTQTRQGTKRTHMGPAAIRQLTRGHGRTPSTTWGSP